MTTRDIVVAGALPRHQVRQYLKALGVEWVEVIDKLKLKSASVGGQPAFEVDEAHFTVTDASEEQWVQIQEWVKKVTG